MNLCNQPEPDPAAAIEFYETLYYWMSNFSAFQVEYSNQLWATTEHAYQAMKFKSRGAQASIRNQWSPHAAKKKAEQMAAVGDGPFARLENWDEVKHDIMKSIIREKIRQHEFVQEKLLATGDRHIIEVSPVDSYWGWGPDRKGENHLGHIWMELREELKTVAGIKA